MTTRIKRVCATAAVAAGLIGLSATMASTPAEAHAVCSRASHSHTGINYTQYWGYSAARSHPVLVSGVWREYIVFKVTTHVFTSTSPVQDPKPFYVGKTC